VRRRALRAALLALAALGLLALARVALWRPRPLAGEAVADGLFRAAGVVHVHSTHSDGGGSPDEIVAAAREAGLAFLALSDHNNLDAKAAEGYQGGLLVLVGSEISTTAGHILALGIEEPGYRFSGDARDALDDVRALGGAAFAAHPTSAREDLRFTGYDLPGDWGMELLNGDSEWRRASYARLLRLGGLYLLNQEYALLSGLTPPDESLRRWDAALARRDVAGIVGADAHSRVPLTRRLALRFPSYRSLFALARNHVLLESPLSGDAARDAAAVVAALRGGRSYVGLDALAPADGFSFVAEGGGRRFTLGQTAPLGPGLVLRAAGRMPAGTRLALYKDGAAQAESAPPLTAPVTVPGVYRVEARVPGWDVPWVMTNPIYVFDEAVRAERASRAAWPADPPAPTPSVMLDGFEGTTVFAPEHDPTSAIATPVLDPAGGADGGGAARLAFRLGVPTAAQPHTWCALVSRAPRDLSGRQGLTFGVRADRVLRFWVQVWDRNPASAEEGHEWWFASVRTATSWQRVTVPFARLRSINPRTDGRLDLDQVTALVFVLDRGAMKPGAAGTLWIDDLGLY
jgi:hypothetical protein